ncbi:Uncharacterized protein PECH_006373 [Penicillium ucsense]|uniref:Kynurenine formamidase n=1 Tax=Penicillium ucsense TaxID=2839758 RepID=A0A8J8W7T9_9EURO|nr:Uncharacterized protein PECM_006941 [Penicillium ucsense]KAF7735675.1 Uncharacterized protein PECH_006373 [Penicillium ucsense]
MESRHMQRKLNYGRHDPLQSVVVEPCEDQKNGYWIIYIHGGAWRDPRITAESFETTKSVLQANYNLPIAGFASLNYRLSASVKFPQDKNTTPAEEYRKAKHPDHIRDVEAALAFLQNTYNFGQRYILVGHSCGATLAFQAVMGAIAGHREQVSDQGTNDCDVQTEPVSSSPEPLPPRLSAHPAAIIGVAGIYDLRAIVKSHRDIVEYRQFVEGAFGADETLWDAVSPAQMVGSRGVEGGWKTGRLAVLVHSDDDELVEKAQLEAMREVLRAWEAREAQIEKQELSSGERRARVVPISGGHDDAWKQGQELARAIATAFAELSKMGLCPESAA